MRDMTVLSTEMYNIATGGEISVKDAVAILKEQAVFRTLKDKLMKFAKGRDIRSLIVYGLLENNHGLSADSVQRKVRGWFNNDERNIKKQDAMELCFILGLSPEEADVFLAMVSEEGIHWRDPEELVYAFALNNKLSYNEARRIYEEISGEIESEEQTEESYTSLVKEDVLKLDSEDDLKAYIRQAKSKLGTYHNTAYAFFTEYMSILENPPSYKETVAEKTAKDVNPDDRAMSVREISETYLGANIIPRFKKKGEKEAASLSLVERNLRSNWPDEFTISRIKNRQMDVTRKILILLFLATDGAESMYDSNYEDCDWDCENCDKDPDECENYNSQYYDMNEEDIFKETNYRLSVMLEKCGFAQLDPRVPFDWMILYCMCVSESWEIDEKMKDFLKEAFGSGNSIQN